MNYEEIVKARRSIRKFTKDKISHEEILKLLDFAMSAPSAMNKQPWEFTVVESASYLEKLKYATEYCSYDAPLAIVVSGNKKRFLAKAVESYWMQDCGASIANLLNGVTYLKLGAVWCGLYPNINGSNEVKSILKLSDDLIPMAIIFIGHPNEEKEPRSQFDESKVTFL